MELSRTNVVTGQRKIKTTSGPPLIPSYGRTTVIKNKLHPLVSYRPTTEGGVEHALA